MGRRAVAAARVPGKPAARLPDVILATCRYPANGELAGCTRSSPGPRPALCLTLTRTRRPTLIARPSGPSASKPTPPIVVRRIHDPHMAPLTRLVEEMNEGHEHL